MGDLLLLPPPLRGLSPTRHSALATARLTRQVRVGEQRQTQYYHRVVVALLLGFHPEVVLGVEPLLSADLRSDLPGTDKRHEGELTAGLRLIRKLRRQYGTWLDLFVLDALYANGPTFKTLEECHYGGVVTLKKESDEPLREALALAPTTPSRHWWDEDRLEEMVVQDIDAITTLDSYPKPVRVVLATVENPKKDEPSCWYAAVVGDRARSLPARTVHRIQRTRAPSPKRYGASATGTSRTPPSTSSPPPCTSTAPGVIPPMRRAPSS